MLRKHENKLIETSIKNKINNKFFKILERDLQNIIGKMWGNNKKIK